MHEISGKLGQESFKATEINPDQNSKELIVYSSSRNNTQDEVKKLHQNISPDKPIPANHHKTLQLIDLLPIKLITFILPKKFSSKDWINRTGKGAIAKYRFSEDLYLQGLRHYSLINEISKELIKLKKTGNKDEDKEIDYVNFLEQVVHALYQNQVDIDADNNNKMLPITQSSDQKIRERHAEDIKYISQAMNDIIDESLLKKNDFKLLSKAIKKGLHYLTIKGKEVEINDDGDIIVSNINKD